ncbi:MAG: SMC-Scp complex subunit ScpB [Alphaproteobacteria bacterium]
MTDKGYGNPPRTNGYDTHETGTDRGTAAMLLERAQLPGLPEDDEPDGADDVHHEDGPDAGAPSPESGAEDSESRSEGPDMPGEPPEETPDTESSGPANGHADEALHEAPPEFTDEDRFRHLRMGEALLFASAEPLRTEQIAERLPEGADVEQVLADLAEHYARRGVNLVRVAGGWAFRTATDLSFLMERERVEQRKLSRAALETLAIIAYHQPVTRAEIEDVRGVSVSKGTLDVLMEIGWVRVRGRRQTPGRPVTYGTTDFFLEHFGLDRVSDLPGLDELKAAGLLDTRMPTNIHIPRPSDEDEPAENGEEEDETDLGYTPPHEAEDSEVSGAEDDGPETEPGTRGDPLTDDDALSKPEEHPSAWEMDDSAAEADFADEESTEEGSGGSPEEEDSEAAGPELDTGLPDDAPSEEEPSEAADAAEDEDPRTG